jgi:hypothetical protein
LLDSEALDSDALLSDADESLALDTLDSSPSLLLLPLSELSEALDSLADDADTEE